MRVEYIIVSTIKLSHIIPKRMMINIYFNADGPTFFYHYSNVRLFKLLFIMIYFLYNASRQSRECDQMCTGSSIYVTYGSNMRYFTVDTLIVYKKD